jgi:hypothetical protein
MQIMKTIQYDNPKVGCYIDESAGSADDCNLRTIQFAASYGFAAGSLPDGDSEDYSEALSDMADNAVMFLNDLETRSFMYWTFDDNSLFLMCDVDSAKEDVGFVSLKTQEYPDDDYRGEWLHVSDHGNATLYVRENGKDTEIWSVV